MTFIFTVSFKIFMSLMSSMSSLFSMSSISTLFLLSILSSNTSFYFKYSIHSGPPCPRLKFPSQPSCSLNMATYFSVEFYDVPWFQAIEGHSILWFFFTQIFFSVTAKQIFVKNEFLDFYSQNNCLGSYKQTFCILFMDLRRMRRRNVCHEKKKRTVNYFLSAFIRA